MSIEISSQETTNALKAIFENMRMNEFVFWQRLVVEKRLC